MEKGQCSGAKEDDDVWAKLVPANSKYLEVDITLQEMVICSEVTSSSPEKHKWCMVTRNSDQISAKIKNISTSAIVVDGTVVEKETALDIKCGSELIPGPDRKGYLAYTFKVNPTQKHKKKSLMIPLDVEDSKCSICLNVWHDVVTVAPCLHNFCNGCFSEWLRRSQEKHQSVLCPHCRASIHSVGRNHFLLNIEEAILQSFSSLKRSDEELALLDKYALIQSNIVLGTQKIQAQKRPLPYSSDGSDNEMDLLCPQCDNQRGGFRCGQTTAHLHCYGCGEMMPSRPDIGVPQQCLGCDREFCAAYWQAQNMGISLTDLYEVCGPETFKPICEYTISRIPDSAHQNNRYEQYVTNRCIEQMGKTLQSVITDLIVKFSNGEIDRSRMPLNHTRSITASTYICNDCYHKLVGYFLYWFRITMPRHLPPPDVPKREDCWYGYACRTQHSSTEHAQKRNHVCRPTRGNLDV